MMVFGIILRIFLAASVSASVLASESSPSSIPTSPTTLTFALYDNGASEGGVDVDLSSFDFRESPDKPGETFAMDMSQRIEVSKYKAEKPVIATRAFREDGELIVSFGQLEPRDDNGNGNNNETNHANDDDNKRRVYLVAQGLEFVWPFIAVGHLQVVSPRVLPPIEEGEQNVVLESLSETPRVFKVLNMFSEQEAGALIDNALSLNGTGSLQRSTVGSGKTEDGEDVAREDNGRTSDNAWDHESPVAKSMITRSFQLTNIKEDVGKKDGLQIVRYHPGQGYNTHPDYFSNKEDKEFDFNPYSGGSNRFATVFMYLNDVEEGGFTAFPNAPGIIPDREPPETSNGMFKRNTWQDTVNRDCYKKLAVPPKVATAALFYSITPDGRVDTSSYHAACPLIKGIKWGANIWIWNGQRYGDIRTGEKRQLDIRNDSLDEDIYISWEGRPNGQIRPGESINMSTFQYHRFKASTGSSKSKAFADFTVQEDPMEQTWVIKSTPPVQHDIPQPAIDTIRSTMQSADAIVKDEL